MQVQARILPFQVLQYVAYLLFLAVFYANKKSFENL